MRFAEPISLVSSAVECKGIAVGILRHFAVRLGHARRAQATSERVL